MTENNQAELRHEGENPFAPKDEKENSTDSPSEETKHEEEENKGDEEGNKKPDEDPDKDKPFHEHPRWTQRESEWTKRFNEQETRHQEDLQKIREEFSGARKENANNTEIPSWFGGDQDQWNAYRADRDKELKEAADMAIKNLSKAKEDEDKAVKDATEYMQKQIEALESDKSINPTGSKIDPNKLLKYVLDNDLVDSQGRWNYRAGFKAMKAESKAPIVETKQRKEIAAATGTEARGEEKPTNYKTGADFKGAKRPW